LISFDVFSLLLFFGSSYPRSYILAVLGLGGLEEVLRPNPGYDGSNSSSSIGSSM